LGANSNGLSVSGKSARQTLQACDVIEEKKQICLIDEEEH